MSKKQKHKKAVKIFFNCLTDPGVLFNLGNFALSIQRSPAAAAFNLAVAGMSAGVRVVSEMEAADIPLKFKTNLGQKFNVFAKNKGAALMTSGVLTLSAALAYASQAGLINEANGSKPALMLGCFGLVHLFRGAATNMNSNLKKATTDAAAFMLAVGGYLFANPTLPMGIKASYLGVASLAMYMATKRETAHGLKQPDLYFAATSIVASIFAPSPEVSLGFLGWAGGYLSLDAMRKNHKDGAYGQLASIKSKTTEFVGRTKKKILDHLAP